MNPDQKDILMGKKPDCLTVIRSGNGNDECTFSSEINFIGSGRYGPDPEQPARITVNIDRCREIGGIENDNLPPGPLVSSIGLVLLGDLLPVGGILAVQASLAVDDRNGVSPRQIGNVFRKPCIGTVNNGIIPVPLVTGELQGIGDGKELVSPDGTLLHPDHWIFRPWSGDKKLVGHS